MLVQFYCLATVLILCSCLFIVPPIWLTSGNLQISKRKSVLYTFSLMLFMAVASIFLYQQVDSGSGKFAHYTPEFVLQQQMYARVRPLYARIQREMVRNELDLKLDLENVELILSFAQIHSQAQQGLLQPEMQALLQAVLRVVPQQVTALNLLAVHAYKSEKYQEAVEYWQQILNQFTPEMRDTEVERILQSKIASTKMKLRN